MSEKESSVASEPTEKELTITRVFDAPRHLVFEAWTNEEHLKQWFAPPDFTILKLEGEYREGGTWLSRMQSSSYGTVQMGGTYQEIIPNEKLVFTHAWDEEFGGTGHETLITVTFADQDGKTLMNFHQATFTSKEIRDDHVGGWTQFFNHLDEYLSQA
jgi:uncharacterized protein YndB with AHSA1/START domain